MTDLARGAMDLRAFSGEVQAAGFSSARRILGMVRPSRPRPPTRRRLRREWAAAWKLLQAEEGLFGMVDSPRKLFEDTGKQVCPCHPCGVVALASQDKLLGVEQRPCYVF